MIEKNFNHEALNINGNLSLVYTAFSKYLFYYRMHISKFVLEKGKVPLNPFMLFDYFLIDSVDRNLVRKANNSVVMRSDEIWVFGPISNGVLSEILIAQKNHKKISYFKIYKSKKIVPIDLVDVDMEEDVKEYRDLIFQKNPVQC